MLRQYMQQKQNFYPLSWAYATNRYKNELISFAVGLSVGT